MLIKIELDQDIAGDILSDLDARADAAWRSSEAALPENRDLAEHHRERFHGIAARRKALCEAINAATGVETKVLTHEQIVALYEAMRSDRHVLELADQSAKRLDCEVLRVKYQEKMSGLEVGMKKLAEAAGLHICPNCLRIGVLDTIPGKEFPDGKAKKGYFCENCTEGEPFEIVREG